MDLRALRYFCAVVQAASLSRAAHTLYVAQPALSAQIKKLEADLGTPLLERSHNGVAPTPAGEQLYQDAQRLLADAQAMRARIQQLPQGPQGAVTVALPFLLASLLLGPVIAQLRHTHPRVRVFVLDDLSRQVERTMRERRADVGVLVDTATLPDLAVAPLAQEAMYLCGWDGDGAARAALCAQHPPQIPFAAAARLPLVLQSRRFAIRQSVQAAADARGIALNIVHAHDSARVIRSLWRCGAGFTLTPACALQEVLPPGAVATPALAPTPGLHSHWVMAQVVNPVLARRYYLAEQRARRRDAAVQAVRAALLAQARALIAQGVWQAQWLHESPPSHDVIAANQ